MHHHGLQQYAFSPSYTMGSSRMEDHAVGTVLSKGRIWDPVKARLNPAVLPYVAAVPLYIAGLITVYFAFKMALPRPPMWATSFVKEPKKHIGEAGTEQKPCFSSWTVCLLISSLFGLIFQTLYLTHHWLQFTFLFSAISWAIALILVAIIRPRTVPYPLLIFFLSIFTSRSIVTANEHIDMHSKYLLSGLDLIPAIASIIVILLMPFRCPNLPTDGISRPFSTPTTELRSPEDNLRLWQWLTVSWIDPLLSVAKKRQLNNEDVWLLPYQFQHRRLFQAFRFLRGSVFRRLLSANGLDIMTGFALEIVTLIAEFSKPLLLQQLLAAVGNPEAPTRAAIIFAFLSWVAGLVQTQTDIIMLWFNRRSYERSRGEMITMLFEKALKRRMVVMPPQEEDEEDETRDPTANGSRSSDVKTEGTLKEICQKLKRGLQKPFMYFSGSSKKYTGMGESKKSASLGKILNILKSDIYEVAQMFWDFGYFLREPAQVILSVVLIWKLLGMACLLGALAIILAQVLTALIARAIIRWERFRRIATDLKLQVVSQFIEAIRHLRWYGWQDSWLKDILEKRQQELNLRIVTSLWNMLLMTVNGFASGLFPFIAFYAYTVLLGKPLRVDLAFPALRLFQTLEMALRNLPGLITKVLNAKVALGRIEDFMKEPDKAEMVDESTPKGEIELQHAYFAWPGNATAVLSDVSLHFIPGLNVIGGKVAAGKTALLLGLLGELDILDGTCRRSSDAIGYCAQTPWLQSLSIRDNILFHMPFDEARYKHVLDACALVQDLANFKHGDLSMIGENGIGLSGGQRARVALARAVYSSAQILILDDPISALDHQTAEWIVRKCLSGPLVEGRTVILVTHRLDICQNVAQRFIRVDNGRAWVVEKTSEISTDARLVDGKADHNDTEESLLDQPPTEGIPDDFIEEEHREHGGVKLSVYWEYVKAGKIKWWALLILLLGLCRLISVGQVWFLKEWGEAYSRVNGTSTPISRLFDSLPSPQSNVRPWLLGFLVITLAQTAASLIANAFMLVIVYSAGRTIFKDAITKVANATFRFYDVTPTGRLMNRMTSDISTIDGNISREFQGFAQDIVLWIASLVVIASVTPIFFVFSIILMATIVWLFMRFLPASQSLRRLEMVSLSPLMSDFGALVDGITTVRAFCAQSRFQDRIVSTTDTFQKMDHFYWSLQAWLDARLDVIGDFGMFVLVLIALYTKVPAGLVAFTLVAASQFVQSTHMLCIQYGQLQMDFVSVERVVELLRLEQEPPGSVKPPASWPTYSGDLVFDNVTVRYAPHLDPALENLSVKIQGGNTTAVVGRTGSGKSTLANTLLATIPPSRGCILIDGIDISNVNKQALRSRVTFLAQDPVLFPGTLRANLDPLSEHSDESCEHVLERVCSSYGWTLDTAIDAGGRNLSQGQRQLIGLARAILRQSSIVILDEATASIDLETSREVQRILREELSGATVVTIAHRVEAVRGAQRYLVLGKGELVEEGGVGEDGALLPERKYDRR